MGPASDLAGASTRHVTISACAKLKLGLKYFSCSDWLIVLFVDCGCDWLSISTFRL